MENFPTCLAAVPTLPVLQGHERRRLFESVLLHDRALRETKKVGNSLDDSFGWINIIFFFISLFSQS